MLSLDLKRIARHGEELLKVSILYNDGNIFVVQS